MSSDSYSFLDVAVLDAVRQRFAAGDALVILSGDLDQVIWANGPGATLFGYPDIETIIGASAGLPPVAKRQIMATGGFPEIGSDRALLLRLATGVSSQAVAFRASAITMPDGEKAILLAAQASEAGATTPGDIAARAIGGFTESGHFIAFIDGEGGVEAASEGFSSLAIGQPTLAALVADVAVERGRVVKRLVPGAAASYPAGFARLTDEPARHLLVVIDEGTLDEGIAPAQETGSVANKSQEPATPADAPTPPAKAVAADTEKQQEIPASDAAATFVPAQKPAADPADAPPVRFVWRTDADGKFSMVSPEFASAVGEPAADIIGRHFKDVATVFGFDPSGEIAGLLARRDTWSGRTVLWPVTGTDRAIPVDLAALPVYDRNRVFEGFRGFGVARGKDAVTDPHRIGLALVRSPEPVQEPAPAAKDTDPFKGETPALTIVPKPERRFTDKVIRLAEHRPPANDKGLSSLERSAFREIGERLRKESEAKSQEAAAEKPAEPAQPEQIARPAPVEVTSPPADEAGRPEIEPQANPTTVQAQDDQEIPGETAAQPDALPPEQESASAAPALTLPRENTVPSAFALPSPADGGPDTSVLGKLPVPLLFHSGDMLHFANEEFLRLTGYETLDDLAEAGGLGALFADPLSQDHAPENGADRMLRLKTQDGREFPIDALLRSVPWGSGKALVLLVQRSGDEEPEAAAVPAPPAAASEPIPLAQPDIAELKARIAEMRTIIDTATDGVVLIDRDGAIRSISRPAEALFGFDSDEVAGKPFPSLFAIESQRAARDYLSGLSDNGVASVLNDGREVIGREAQGRFIPLFMTIGRLPNDSGFCAVVRDITQWKRAEEDLTQARAVAERASSQKTDFLARISHEIRTPLNAIIGFSELMVDEKFGPVANDRYRDYLRDINRSGNHVLDLVNDLLDISKIEAGQQEMDYEAVSLNDTLAETVAMMQPQANRERVIIRSSFASKLPEVVADQRSVRQIALNILSNAIRYTQAGGQVIVSTAYETSGDVVMRVRDTGIGMSQAEIEQALKPFRQINALKRGRNDGTGLGLPLTKAMVEANRARFTINSTPGEGTLVEVAFPSTRVLAE
ncbi:PAS domain S-box protein [Aquamicrobium soli]|uniref:histidine kinase n=1 Tax=Aquamicrobium soli TaxID=1811518 RepID=A0ABV7K783_9HYPH